MVVFLWIPHKVRMARLREREIERFGLDAISPGGWFYENHLEFIDWAAQYDKAGVDMRSRALHEEWMNKLPCELLRLEQPMTVHEMATRVEEALNLSI